MTRRIDASLHALVDELFKEDLFGSLRRVQGLVRTCTKEIRQCGREAAIEHIRGAIAAMHRFGKVRVPYFKQLLADARRKKIKPDAGREIVRRPGNPMLRHGGECAATTEPLAAAVNQGSLPL